MSELKQLKRVLSKLLDGIPSHLPSGAFVPVYARRLRHARVVWVNWPLLRELGADVDPHGLVAEREPQGLSPDVEQILLRAFAWRIPDEEGDTSTFVGRPRAFYADRYGGDGVAPNMGSGRAASAGLIQIKGIGMTPLVHPSTPFEHRHGSLSLGDALREAAWSELNHAEAPHGSNRVLAIVDAATSYTLPDGRVRRRGLLVRLSPVRPAHFIPNMHSRQSGQEFRELQRHLARSLPLPRRARAFVPTTRLRFGLLELAGRAGEQHAALMAHRAPHGALSSSNLELSGRLLDFETQSTQPGHGSTLAIRGSAYRSDSASSLNEMLRSLAFSAALGLPERLAQAVPSQRELQDALVHAHGQMLMHRMMALCGFPEFLLALGASSAGYAALANRIHDVAFEPAEPTLIERGVPAWTGRYDVGAVLYCLACLRRKGLLEAKRLLLRPRSPEKLVELVQEYFTFREELDELASARGYSTQQLDELIIRLACVRNAKRPNLYLPQLQKRNALILQRYVASGSSALLQCRIDDLIEGNRRFFPDAPTRCVLRHWQDRVGGAQVTYSFVPHRGYVLELTAPAVRGHARFFGHRASVANRGTLPVSVRLGARGGKAAPRRFELALDSGGNLRLALLLDPDLVRFAVCLDPERSRNSSHVVFEPLPRMYLQGVRQIERHERLAQKVSALT
jgi:hypothetical protein